jgi:hypothetical protein
MTSDLNVRLSASLREQADAGTPVDPAPLLVGAVTKGRRLRRRRRVIVAGAAALVLLSVGAAAVLPNRHRPTPADTGPAGLTMPIAKGVPGAAQRPGLVGTDGQVLHFAVDKVAAGATSVFVGATDTGSESASVGRTDGSLYLILTRSPVDATFDQMVRGWESRLSKETAGSVGTHPATLRTATKATHGRTMRFVVWQPVPGVWAHAQVATSTWPMSERLLMDLQFDRATRCALPFRLTYQPAPAHVVSCNITLSKPGYAPGTDGTIVLADSSARSMRLNVVTDLPGAPLPITTPQTDPNRVINVSGGGGTIQMDRYTVSIASPAGVPGHLDSLNDAEVTKMLHGVRSAPDPDDQRTW